MKSVKYKLIASAAKAAEKVITAELAQEEADVSFLRQQEEASASGVLVIPVEWLLTAALFSAAVGIGLLDRLL